MNVMSHPPAGEFSLDFGLAHTYSGVPYTVRLTTDTVLSRLQTRAKALGTDPYVTLITPYKEITISYVELNDLSLRFAEWLREEWHVSPGETIGILPSTDIQSIIAIFAVLRSGCVALLMSPSDPCDRLRSQADALQPKMIFGTSATAKSLPEAVEIPDVHGLPQLSDNHPGIDIQPDSAALLFGTSGSTATAKIVVQSHYNAAINAFAVGRHHRLRAGDRILGCLPLHHVNGVHFTLFATLFAGAHAVLVDTFDPFTYGDLIRRFKPRVASVVPTILEGLLQSWDGTPLPSDFDYFVSAAAPLNARTARAVEDEIGAKILQGYGLTETTNFSTTMPIDIPDEEYRGVMSRAEIPSVGIAIFGNDVAVLRQDGTRASIGEIGEVCVRGHNVMLGYAGNASATAEAFRFGWFHSQDLGFESLEPRSNTTFVTITGRIKNIAKVGGEAVSLEEMERLLRMLPDVRDAACVAVPHVLLGDEIVAAIVSDCEVTPDRVRDYLRRIFSSAALPRRLVRLQAIPRTLTGKIRRNELLQRVLPPTC